MGFHLVYLLLLLVCCGGVTWTAAQQQQSYTLEATLDGAATTITGVRGHGLARATTSAMDYQVTLAFSSQLKQLVASVWMRTSVNNWQLRAPPIPFGPQINTTSRIYSDLFPTFGGGVACISDDGAMFAAGAYWAQPGGLVVVGQFDGAVYQITQQLTDLQGASSERLFAHDMRCTPDMQRVMIGAPDFGTPVGSYTTGYYRQESDGTLLPLWQAVEDEPTKRALSAPLALSSNGQLAAQYNPKGQFVRFVNGESGAMWSYLPLALDRAMEPRSLTLNDNGTLLVVGDADYPNPMHRTGRLLVYSTPFNERNFVVLQVAGSAYLGISTALCNQDQTLVASGYAGSGAGKPALFVWQRTSGNNWQLAAQLTVPDTVKSEVWNTDHSIASRDCTRLSLAASSVQTGNDAGSVYVWTTTTTTAAASSSHTTTRRPRRDTSTQRSLQSIVSKSDEDGDDTVDDATFYAYAFGIGLGMPTLVGIIIGIGCLYNQCCYNSKAAEQSYLNLTMPRPGAASLGGGGKTHQRHATAATIDPTGVHKQLAALAAQIQKQQQQQQRQGV